jgi:hypothetical protein
LELSRPQHGEWTWKIHYQGTTRVYSTFHSSYWSLDQMKRKADDFRPTLNEDGSALQLTLGMMSGTRSNREIVAALCEAFPDLFPSRRRAAQYVGALSVRFGFED